MAAAHRLFGRLLLSLLLLVLLMTQVRGLRCWTCSSGAHGMCGDPFNSSSVWQEECRAEEPPQRWGASVLDLSAPLRRPVCKKVKQIERGRLVYIRSCGLEAWQGQACLSESEMQLAGDSSRGEHFCDTCRSELCNAAPPSAGSAALTALLCVALLLALQR